MIVEKDIGFAYASDSHSPEQEETASELLPEALKQLPSGAKVFVLGE